MEEELLESDVLWPDHHHYHNHHDDRCCHQKQQLEQGRRQPPVHAAACGCDVRRRPASSAPVPIPVSAVRSSSEPGTAAWAQCHCYEDSDEASFVPPHVVVARRWCSEERVMASSVCVGQGRTLKGRDLQCVRAAVLRMTGFLET